MHPCVFRVIALRGTSYFFMRVEVDQSGKIEWTQKPTALALANGIRYSVFISAKAKREVLEELERRRPTNNRTNHHLLVFATLLFLLLRDQLPRLTQVVVDVEYHGHDARIKEHFLNLCRRHNIQIDRHVISFHRVGKKSPAHNLAIAVFRGDTTPSREIQAHHLLREITPKKGK